MRRLFALVLLLVSISLSLVSPMLWAGTKKELPACCRRDGKHHCAQNMSTPAQSGVQVTSASVCPMFPQGRSAPSPVQNGTAPQELGSFAGLIRAPRVEAPAPVADPDAALPQPWLQRGPPSFVS
ncbi:MAG TPA: hypothetical protein VFQ91_28410 [Bryobacteraceae bacterium]|nr:hypothetical protein [Bryobacteraceae bacterium]